MLHHHTLLCILTFFAAGTVAADEHARGLIASYACDVDASDSSGQRHDAANHGARPCPDGRIGAALEFDGVASYLALPADATGDALFGALYERVLQGAFWTQKTEGNLMGAMYERICDPWNARGEGFDSLGTLYLNELSLDAMLQLLDMGAAKPPAPCG